MVELTQLKAAFFLKEFKMLVQEAGLYAVNGRYHQNALAELGLTRQDREHEILGLSVEDYSDAPRTDRDRPGEVWIFGKEISGREIYIKLKIAWVGSEKIAKCISFHAAERPLHYPFK